MYQKENITYDINEEEDQMTIMFNNIIKREWVDNNLSLSPDWRSLLVEFSSDSPYPSHVVDYKFPNERQASHFVRSTYSTKNQRMKIIIQLWNRGT